MGFIATAGGLASTIGQSALRGATKAGLASRFNTGLWTEESNFTQPKYGHKPTAAAKILSGYAAHEGYSNAKRTARRNRDRTH